MCWEPGVLVCWPVMNPTPQAIASWCCALCCMARWHPEDGASCLCEGCPVLGTLPPLAACPLGVQTGPAVLSPWARGPRVWEPIIDSNARALAWVRCALFRREKGAQEGTPRASLRGFRGLELCVPQRPVLCTCRCGPVLSFLGRRWCRCGGPSGPHTARSRELALRLAGAAESRPTGGGTLCLREGCGGLVTLYPPVACPAGVLPGPTALFLPARRVRLWGASPLPQRTLFGAGIARCVGGRKPAGGGCPVTCSDGDAKDCPHCREPTDCSLDVAGAGADEARTPLLGGKEMIKMVLPTPKPR